MTAMLVEVVPQPRAWRGPSLARDEYLMSVPEQSLAIAGDRRHFRG